MIRWFVIFSVFLTLLTGIVGYSATRYAEELAYGAVTEIREGPFLP